MYTSKESHSYRPVKNNFNKIKFAEFRIIQTKLNFEIKMKNKNLAININELPPREKQITPNELSKIFGGDGSCKKEGWFCPDCEEPCCEKLLCAEYTYMGRREKHCI